MSDKFYHYKLWAAFTLAYYGLLRAAEYTVLGSNFNPAANLQVSDVEFCTHFETGSYMSVHIKRSKTDYENRGTVLYIGCSRTSVCAVCAYIKRRGNLHISQPLFIFSSGQVLTQPSFLANLLSLASIDSAISTEVI